MKHEIEYYKSKLEAEKAKITDELSSMSKKNPKNPDDWEAVYPKEASDVVFREETEDNIEEYENRYSLNDTLEKRLREINDALFAVEKGTYGKCLMGGKPHPIDEGRLEANPAAITCIEHSKA